MDKQYIKRSKKLGKNLTRTVEINATDVKVSHDLVLPTTEPDNPVDGSIYLDTSTNEIMYYSNGTWH